MARHCPNLLTAARLVLAVLLAGALIQYRPGWALLWWGTAVLTDLLDGWLARRLDACSPRGALFDATADFVLLWSAFAVWVWRGAYPTWFLLLLALLFGQFLLSARRGRLVYDPVGKYYGTALYAALGALLLLPDYLFSYALLAGLTGLAVVSLSVKVWWQWRQTISPRSTNDRFTLYGR